MSLKVHAEAFCATYSNGRASCWINFLFYLSNDDTDTPIFFSLKNYSFVTSEILTDICAISNQATLAVDSLSTKTETITVELILGTPWSVATTPNWNCIPGSKDDKLARVEMVTKPVLSSMSKTPETMTTVNQGFGRHGFSVSSAQFDSLTSFIHNMYPLIPRKIFPKTSPFIFE